MNATTLARPPIGWLNKALYSSGSMSFGIKDNGFAFFLMIFYNQVVGLPSVQVGLAVLIALVADAFLDPLIGQVSDSARFKWGRRHPFMYAAAIPVAVSFFMLWNPPAWSNTALFFYLIGIAIIVRSFVSLYEVPSAALVPELTANYDERTTLVSLRYYFGWIGSIAMQILALRVFFAGEEGQLARDGYTKYSIVAAAVMFIAIMASALGTHRYIPYLQPPPPRQPFSFFGVLRDMARTVSNRSLLMILLSTMCTIGAGGLAVALSLYFMRFFWQLSSDQISYFPFALLVAATIASAIAPALGKRFGKKNSALAAFGLSTIFIAAPVALKLLDLMPEKGTTLLFWVLIAFTVAEIATRSLGSIMSLSMIADCVEDSQVSTGRRSEGLVSATFPFAQKCSSGIGNLLSGLILYFVAFPQGARPGQVSMDTLFQLGLAFVLVLLAIKLLGLFFVSQYRITRATHEANVAKLGAAAPPVAEANP